MGSNHHTPEMKGNGRDPGGEHEWAVSARGVSNREPNVPNWGAGPNEFLLQARQSALEKFFGDNSDPSNRSTYGVRSSAHPAVWANFKALDCSDAAAEVQGDGKTVRHKGLWGGGSVDVDLVDEGRILKEILRLAADRKAEWSSYFEWTLKVAPGCSAEIVDNCLLIRDPEGVVRIESRAPIGWDSSTTAPTPDGKQVIRCTLEFAGTRQGLPVVRLTPHPEDLEAANGDVELDPTLFVTSTSDIDDTLVHQGSPASNYGTLSDRSFQPGLVGLTKARRMLVRVQSSAIPEGSISLAEFRLIRKSYGPQTQPGTLSAYAISAANAGWGELTATWGEHTKGFTFWAGSAGLGTVVTDYLAVAIGAQVYSVFIAGSDVLFTVGLDTATFEAWQSGAQTNSGMLWRTPEVVNDLLWGDTSEGVDPLEFYFEYSVPTGGRTHATGRGLSRGIGRGLR